MLILNRKNEKQITKRKKPVKSKKTYLINYNNRVDPPYGVTDNLFR